LISVILPVRNGMPFLEDQLRALDAQKCPEPWEVLIAENGSTDGTRELAERWASEHHRFRVVDASSLNGASAARNFAVGQANGDLLAFCDADDVVHAGWLDACVAGLKKADVIAGGFDFWSLNSRPATLIVPAASRQLGFLPFGLGANLAVKRKAFDQVSGFSDAVLPGEDIDLCWRLQLEGFTFEVVLGAVVAKRERAAYKQVFDQAFAFGRCGPALHRRYRSVGAHRDPAAFKAWVWLAFSSPLILNSERRGEWVRIAGLRLGRLAGSFRERVFFP
jgi:glycosyltransferase involved in cell wall biosynthesis